MPEVLLLSCSSLGLPGSSGSSMSSRDPWLPRIFLQSSTHSRGCSSSYFFACCLGRFRKSIIGCSKMFLAVSAAWDKWKKNMHEHLSGRREQPRWCCYRYYRKIWYCESMKWPSEQAYLLTELLTGSVHTCAFMQSIYLMLYTNSIQNKLDYCKTNFNEDQGKKKISEEAQDFSWLRFCF